MFLFMFYVYITKQSLHYIKAVSHHLPYLVHTARINQPLITNKWVGTEIIWSAVKSLM